MPRRSSLTEKQVVRALLLLGFQKQKPKGGGHIHYVIEKARGRRRKVTVDGHIAPFSHTLIHHMANQAGLTVRELYAAVEGEVPRKWPL